MTSAARTRSPGAAGQERSCRSGAAVAFFLAVLAACSPASETPAEDDTWVGTVTTEGNVTTVVNESGSVWGGTATLVEEASIGAAVGAEEYMLGEISHLYATADEIYVVDQSVSKIRIYDLAGNHLRSFGGAGQGPGELGRFVRGMLVGDDGRVYIGDLTNQRINIYSSEGDPAGEISLPARSTSGIVPMVWAGDGGIWLTVRVPGEDGAPARSGVQVLTAEGPVGDPLLVPEIEYEELFIQVRGRDLPAVPFAPRVVWTFGYDQVLIAGASNRYALRMIRPTGETTHVERSWDPVPVTAEEADYWRRFTSAGFPEGTDWNGENMPDHKPAFLQFLPSASGELWVMRQGDGGLGPCDREPEEAGAAGFDQDVIECLYANLFFDVFDADGRYLGDVEGLQMTNTPPFVAGDTVIAAVEDEAGTIMVKRYRRLLPAEQ